MKLRAGYERIFFQVLAFQRMTLKLSEALLKDIKGTISCV